MAHGQQNFVEPRIMVARANHPHQGFAVFSPLLVHASPQCTGN